MTARLQIERMCAGTPVTPDDLADDAYALVAATLPTALRPGADAVSEAGLVALGLPATYPIDDHGQAVPRETCQAVGSAVKQLRQSGVWCRSACTEDGRGREFAWFSGSQRATAIWDQPSPFGLWRHANTWRDIELADQSDPT